jgi:O-antigen/teichoic acid export membrane protein
MREILRASLAHPTRIKVLTNTTFQFIGRVIGAGVSFLITILIARQFGASGYGDFVKITTFVAFFYLLADFGFNAMFLRRGDSWGTLVALRFIVGVLLVFGCLAALVFFPQGTGQGYTALVRLGIILLAPSILFQAFITTANALFQKHLRYDLATIALIIGSVVSLFFVFVATQIFRPESGILFSILALLIGSLIAAVAAMVFAQKNTSEKFIDTRLSPITSLFTASIPLGLTLLFNLVYFHADSVILTLTRSTSEVGMYGLAYKVFEFPLVIPIFFMNAVYPVMLQATSNKQQGTGKRLRFILCNSAIFLFLVSCLLSLVFWFAAPLLTIIRSDFAQSIPPLRVLVLGLPIFYLSALVMWTLITLKKQMQLAVIYAAAMMLNIALNIFYVPSYGMLASAWITIGSEAFVLVLSSFMLYQLRSQL